LNSGFSQINPAEVFISFIVLVFSLTVHEFAHAITASRLGDQTAEREGRVTLNPLAHIDLIGTVIFPLLALIFRLPLIGWAKPVPVSVRGLAHPRRDLIVIALAGPASNVVLALLAAVVLRLLPTVATLNPGGELNVGQPLMFLTQTALLLNLLLALFNLVPIPPLDGGNVLSNLLPPAAAYRFDTTMRPYGFLVLYALMLTGVLWMILGPPFNFLATLLLP
jgi:Zn-dependent protease